MSAAFRLAAAALLIAGCAGLALPRAASPDLRGVGGLARTYQHILDARFDELDADLARACGPSPLEACHVLRATALWWQILLDPASPALAGALQQEVERAVAAAEAWTTRAPDEAEAWFYLGGAYAVRVQSRVLRGERLAAARDGKKIKAALERTLELDPGLVDADFGIGLYRYYADVAPTAAKILRWLLLLPGGDREDGLARMLRVQNRGELLQGEADYQLHLIYLWYERQPGRALALLQSLQSRYPGNPLFPLLAADVEAVYFHDVPASIDTLSGLVSAALNGRVNQAGVAEARARLALARKFEALWQTDRAIEQLQAVLDKRPSRPYGAVALAQLQLGAAYDRLGRRDEAVAAYRRALAAAPPGDPDDIRDDATQGLRRQPDSQAALAYRLSLEGWRLFERRAIHEAGVALRRAVDLQPADPVARYRYGRVLAGRDDHAALMEFQRAIDAGRRAPAPILAAAYLEAARITERAGRRQDAIDLYRAAAAVFGGGQDARRTAARALTRLGTHPTDPARDDRHRLLPQ
jgi:tetratricopeptide (TPR) repeat protein